MRDIPYSRLEQFLHKLALDRTESLELALTLDEKFYNRAKLPQLVDRPVFVTGLARSGTTVLLRLLHGSGVFASLTYANMPFVAAPALWSKIANQFRKCVIDTERAHGDGVKVGYHSPEAFEEVVWRALYQDKFIASDHLSEMDPLDETERDRFSSFVRRFVATSGDCKRYLSKNNNNIIRLDEIIRIFPDAIIFVPFRDPASFVKSTIAQHKRFLKWHEEDAFTRRYMRWLGHFEFGSDFRPVGVAGNRAPSNGPQTIDDSYIWDYWADVYGRLLETLPTNARFFSYNGLCSNPDASKTLVAQFAGIDPAGLVGDAIRSEKANTCQPGQDVDAERIKRALAIYDRLETIALNGRKAIPKVVGSEAA